MFYLPLITSVRLRLILFYVPTPRFAVPFLNPGRLVKVRDGETEWGWGAVVNFAKKKIKSE